jgi:uncharacterized membrane protein YeaQ/YmgE (transglycosylase-associated protein family)
MSGKIFISYRREESRWSARSLYDHLSAHFDRDQIFMDVDTIAPGIDFVDAIEKMVGECDVLIAVIGEHWLTSPDEQEGRRLDNPEDFLRTEIATALKRDIRVIPVLVDGALMPRSSELPDDLKALVRRNALRVSHTGFDDDCRRLVAAIEEVFVQKMARKPEREPHRRLQKKPQNLAHFKQKNPVATKENVRGAGPTWTGSYWLNYIWFALIGVVASSIVTLVTQHEGEFVLAIAFGTIGSIAGGLIARLFSKPVKGSPFHPAGLILSVIGALLSLLLLTKL